MGTFSKTFGACLVQQGANINQLPENYWKEEDSLDYFIDEETNEILIID